jgi:hypothetical protein
VNDEVLLVAVAGAHRDEGADAVETPRVRRLPRHRARRSRWKPPLEPVHPQHAYDRDALFG